MKYITTYKEFLMLNESLKYAMNNNILWRFREPLKNPKLVDDFFKHINKPIPKGYKDIVVKYDGGSPTPYCFNTNRSRERVFEYLLRFNKNARYVNSIYDYNNGSVEFLDPKYIPFAYDPFGNLICFDYSNNKKEPAIVFWNHEEFDDRNIEFIANSFLEFLDKLFDPFTQDDYIKDIKKSLSEYLPKSFKQAYMHVEIDNNNKLFIDVFYNNKKKIFKKPNDELLLLDKNIMYLDSDIHKIRLLQPENKRFTTMLLTLNNNGSHKIQFTYERPKKINDNQKKKSVLQNYFSDL